MLLNDNNSNFLSLPIFSKTKLDLAETISKYLQDENITRLSEHISKVNFVMMVFGTINNLLCIHVFASKEFRKLKFKFTKNFYPHSNENFPTQVLKKFWATKSFL